MEAPDGGRFAVGRPQHERNALIFAVVALLGSVWSARTAESGEFDLVDLAVAEPTLETVFIKLTGKDLRE